MVNPTSVEFSSMSRMLRTVFMASNKTQSVWLLSHQRARLRTACGDHAGADDDMNIAREWLAGFEMSSIPQDICEVTYSRASGPGGQNVNKVNSKATLKVHMTEIEKRIPAVVRTEVRRSRYFAPKANCLVLHCDESRKQKENTIKCHKKLYDLILEAGKKAIPGKTSLPQKERVESLKSIANSKRLHAKKLQSNIKQLRRGDNDS